MGFFSDLMRIAGPIASVVPGGQGIAAGLGALNMLTEGGKAERGARRAEGQNAAMIASQRALYEQLRPIIEALAAQAMNPAYAGAAGVDPFGEAAQDAAYQGFAESAARDASSAFAANRIDPYSRGLVSTTGSEREGERIQGRLASDLAGFRRDTRLKAALDRRTQMQQAEDARFQRLMALVAPMQNMASGVQNGIGGQQSLYQNQADRIGAGIGQTVEALARAGALGRGRGDNRSGTNQVGQNPMRTPQGLTIPTITPPFVATPPTMPTLDSYTVTDPRRASERRGNLLAY